MKQIVINACYGGFGLSEQAMRRYAELKGIALYPETNPQRHFWGPTYYTVPPEQRTPPLENWNRQASEVRIAHNQKTSKEVLYDRNIERDDPALVQVVLELGTLANDKYAKLRVVEIPDDVSWVISEYDGNETVEEEHRSWS